MWHVRPKANLPSHHMLYHMFSAKWCFVLPVLCRMMSLATCSVLHCSVLQHGIGRWRMNQSELLFLIRVPIQARIVWKLRSQSYSATRWSGEITALGVCEQNITLSRCDDYCMITSVAVHFYFRWGYESLQTNVFMDRLYREKPTGGLWTKP